jgi:hypothetical protein
MESRKEQVMKSMLKRMGLALFPVGWIVAAVMSAAPTTVLADDYASAAAASGATAFYVDVFEPGPVFDMSAHAIAAPGAQVASASQEEFYVEIWTGEPGAASGEPDELVSPAPRTAPDASAWVQSIWNTP